MKEDKVKGRIYIRIEEVKIGLDESEAELAKKIMILLVVDSGQIVAYQIIKKAVDSRNKRRIIFVYSLDVELKEPKAFLDKISNARGEFLETVKRHKLRGVAAYDYKVPAKDLSSSKQPLVVGSGPAGLFCALTLARAGLRPIIVERGAKVEKRIKDVEKFFKTGKLNLNSNVQFGEGGAGTFSDGKLYTLINDPRSKYVFDEFVRAGAPEEIAWNANPHIGTDKLREVVKNLRKEIEKLGGEFRFNSCLTGLDIKNNQIKAVVINHSDIIKTDNLILAIGHSARDSYEMLYDQGLTMLPKTFSIGLRIEHKAEMINRAQYGEFYHHPKLPTARYKLVAHVSDHRSVYTFCMCPGGYVIAASSEKERLAINGMSEYAQDGENSNSAILVNIFPSDFASDHPLAGIEFQRKWESLAYQTGGGGYSAPAQRLGDFLQSKASSGFSGISPSYRPGVTPSNLTDCLPDFVLASIKAAIPLLDQKIKGFAHPEAVLTAIESRSSSPVRIVRDENFQANIKGVYPAGEGAGYAGGITSSAIDGVKIAEQIISQTN